MKNIIVTIPLIFICTICSSQIFKNLDKKIQDRVERRIEERIKRKAEEKTDDAMDVILDGKGAKKNKKQTSSSGKGNNNSKGKNSSSSRKSNSNKKRSTKSAKDFVPGTQVIFQESFSRDVIGDFPGTWNTNSSGEIVTFNDDGTRWLKMVTKGNFTPDGIRDIPDNSTLEFDLAVDDNASNFSPGVIINIVELTNRTNDFTKWKSYPKGNNGVQIGLLPTPTTGKGDIGRTNFKNKVNGNQIISNRKNNAQFTPNNTTVHVTLWRQKTRLRVYLNDEKVWDIPRAFGDANYNGLVFFVDTRGEAYYVSNIRLAKAGADTRHKLLETGSFSTNEILFETGSAKLKSSSNKHIDEIGELLVANPNLKLRITGHTDSDGDEGSNFLLSESRALAVKRYLSNNYPIPGNRLITEGKGESTPIANNNSAAGKSQNRRVEFQVIK